jgi:O-antigen ligase
MMATVLALAAAGFIVFLLLPTKFKALISFLIMMQGFDVIPSILFGMYVWDYGAILMLVTAVEVYLRKPGVEPVQHGYLLFLKLFLAWLVFCLLWSLLINQYPILHTVKNARAMILGYFMTLIFIRLFTVQPGSFEFLMKWFYWLSYALMPVFVLQSVLNKQILFETQVDYEGSLRAIPVFLPFCMLNFWVISAKFLSSAKVQPHEWGYAALALVTVALTYTRGIYISMLLMIFVLMWIMSRDRMLKAPAVFAAAMLGVLVILALVASGAADKVTGRIASGLDLLGSVDTAYVGRKKDDTFTGRLNLVAERVSLVWQHNPLVGYGFIHEEDVPPDLRKSLRFGTAMGGTAADPTAYSRYNEGGHYSLGLYTADIAWADIILSTGFVGALLLASLILTFLIGHFRGRNVEHPMGYAVRTGLFLLFFGMVLLMFDGDKFYGSVHIPAFLLAGYALSRERAHHVSSPAPVMPARPANLMT